MEVKSEKIANKSTILIKKNKTTEFLQNVEKILQTICMCDISMF